MSKRKKILVTLLLIFLPFAFFCGTICIGRYYVSFTDVFLSLWQGITGHKSGLSPETTAVVLQIRLPRAFLGAIVGASLGASGAAFQGLFRNPLVSGGSLISDAEKTMTTLEQIYNWNPDAIIANDANTTKYMLSDSKWTGLAAVKNARVITTLPVGVTRWDHPGSIEPHMAALFIARLYYPEQFTDIDLAQITKDDYKKWFDLDLTDEAVTAILSGEGMRLSK